IDRVATLPFECRRQSPGREVESSEYPGCLTLRTGVIWMSSDRLEKCTSTHRDGRWSLYARFLGITASIARQYSSMIPGYRASVVTRSRRTRLRESERHPSPRYIPR